MKSYQSRDARLKMRDILTAAEQGEPVELKRYDTVTAVVVPAAFYDQAVQLACTVDLMLEDEAAGREWQSGMHALRDIRRKAGKDQDHV
jgi:antitoxin (DNA-binding transcriptional repressor) of toxin-antitoxin stability system